MGARIGMKHAFWCIIWILSSLSWILFLSQDCTSTSSTIHRPRTFLLSDQDTQDYNPPNILTETTHPCISESVKCFSSMEDDQVLFNSSQASMSVTFKYFQYTALYLHGLCNIEYTTCPLTVETCKRLDSLDLLRQPCITHLNELPPQKKLSRRKRWRHRGKRGGRRLNTRPISVHISPSSTRVAASRRTQKHIVRNLVPIKCISQYQSNVRARFAHWNARSITNKTASICDFVISEKLYIFAFTESWLNGDSRDNRALADIHNALPAFTSYSIPRLNRTGGGIFLLLLKGFRVVQNVCQTFTSFEYGDFIISSQSASLRLVIVYRMRYSKKNKNATAGTFFTEFSVLMESLALTSNDNLLICGDFNFYVEIATDRDARNFLDLLQSANLCQHVTGPTHIGGHTLDLLITPEDDSVVGEITIQQILPSDHFATVCNIDIGRPEATKEIVRRLQDIDVHALQQDILASSLYSSPANDLDSLAEQYDTVLSGLMDKYAPIKIRTRFIRSHSPWFCDDLREKKQELRLYERKWVKSGLQVDRQVFREKCAAYKYHLEQAKTSYHRSQILNCDQSQLFKLVDRMCVKKSANILPVHESPKILADNFATFFDEKVQKLHGGFNKIVDANVVVPDSESLTSHSLSNFHRLSEVDVHKLLNSMPSKSCPLDPMPTSLVKQCSDELLPIITKIINSSLSAGHFPSSFKTAEVIPLLKKSTLDPESLQSYRSVSNLKFISKATEKAAIEQLQHYLTDNDLFPHLQSAYRKHHSCETALLRVLNDLLSTVDAKRDAVLVLLDLSAAFDTIDHNILIQRLKIRYGLSGSVLEWFDSYIRGRNQVIKIGDSKSDPHLLLSGVPQGSVAGPQIFTLYSSPIEDIVKRYPVSGMFYADDSQLYVSLNPTDISATLTELENCIKEIKNWTLENKLALNDSKTEVVYLSSRFSETVLIPSINVGDSVVDTVAKAKDLGVIIDQHLTLVPHVNNISRLASHSIRNIGRIRKYLDRNSTEKLVHAFVSSRLDSNNSILYGLPKSELSKLQRIQNAAARLVTLSKKREHITPVLKDLHWLPVESRIIYKLMLLTFKALNNQAPKYLCELISIKKSSRSLRSNTSIVLHRKKANTVTYGQRSFHHAAPELWNQLPSHVKNATSLQQFKSLLKAHLFSK